MRKILMMIIAVLILSSPSYAGSLIDRSKIRMPDIDDMNMGAKVLPNYTGTGVFIDTDDTKDYNLQRMKQMNPDFTTYPESHGIIWQKKVKYTRSESGGIDVTRLYVILGRRGLSGKWLNWNIPTPAKGSTEIIEASVYDSRSLAKISKIEPEEDITAGITQVRFMGLPDTFILVISWRETLPDMLGVEGLSWFQEDLRVWESVTEIHSPQKLSYRAFPAPLSPQTDDLGTETVYTWRRVNVDPYNDSSEIARLQRAGVAFSTRQGNSNLQGMMKDIENAANIPAPADAVSGFKRSNDTGTVRLMEWLMSQPEITLAEGTPRKIPSSGEWTKREKLLLAKSWLTSQKVNASLAWKIPFDPDERTPICPAIFGEPVLDVQEIRGVTFHDMNSPELIGGTKIFTLNDKGTLAPRRIPSSKSSENRLSAVMDLSLSDFGSMSGKIRLILRGAWGDFLLGNNPSEGTARGAVLSLFPGLTNYKDVKYRKVKGVPEVSFTLENKPGIGGTGRGILAILPFFEPQFVRRLGTYEPPVEIKFPFIIDQNITLSFPKNATEALVSGKTGKNPDKINYSDKYQNKRHRLEAESRFELNMTSVTAGNMNLLRRCLENWRIFSSKHIPIR
ncbi:MAG: hypothetical protein IJQ08_09185 [Synergistaceae bacterium]|nr:hypothetical protein [Synergistaceae bacterium]